MEETREIDIDLGKIIYMMRNKIVYILLITILMGVVAGAFTHFFIKPTYTATVKFYARNSTDIVSTESTISDSAIDASQKITGLCVYIAQSDTVLDKVAEELQMGSAESVKNYISADTVKDIQAFTVTVKHRNRDTATKIANTIAKIAPEEIVRIIKGGSVEVIDYAKVPKEPSSPNLKKNILIGAIIGFALSFAAFFITEIFDTTITEAKDLEKDFEIPVLGTIPRLEPVNTEITGSASSLGGSNDPLDAITKPSSDLLKNIQNVKGDVTNEQKN